jgi:uncharacterized membrane protein (UPF0136 family)
VNIRLVLQPWWLRFLVAMPIFAVIFAVMIYVGRVTETIKSSIISGVIFGVVFAAINAYQGQAMHRGLVDAVAGLDKTLRSEAIAAVTDGVVPADPVVQRSAARIGLACLRGKTIAELKRAERRSWITAAIVVALFIVAAATQNTAHDVVYYLALGLIVAIALPVSILRTRRFHRNCALLAETLPSP